MTAIVGIAIHYHKAVFAPRNDEVFVVVFGIQKRVAQEAITLCGLGFAFFAEGLDVFRPPRRPEMLHSWKDEG